MGAMNLDFLRWLSIVIELLGLALIAFDLFLPRMPDTLRRAVDAAVPQPLGGTERQRQSYRLTTWIGLYAVVWIALAGGLSMFDARLGVAANIVMAALTALVLLLLGLVRFASEAGVALGRATSLGTLGLATALIGVSIQLAHLWIG